MIRKIGVKNYKKWRELEVTLPAGIVCITGANGQGKTSLCNVISTCMFGASRGVPIKSDTELQLALMLDKDYEINRRGAEITLNTEPKSITEVEAVFNRYFSSVNTFKTLFVIEQGFISPFSVATKSNIRKYFGALLGLDKVADILLSLNYSKNVKSDLTVCKEKFEVIQKELNIIPNLDTKDIEDVSSKRKRFEEIKYVTAEGVEAYQEVSKKLSALWSLRVYFTKVIELLQDVLRATDTAVECPICASSVAWDTLMAQLQSFKEKATTVEAEVKAADTKIDKSHTAPLLKEKEELEYFLKHASTADDLYALYVKRKFLEREKSTSLDQQVRYEKDLSKCELYHLFYSFEEYAYNFYISKFLEFANIYLETYTKFRNIQLTEQEITVNQIPIQQLSFGERATVLTAVHLSLAQIYCELFLSYCPFIIFDSAFDFVDTKNAEDIIEMLRNSPFKQVVVTTHTTSVISNLGLQRVTLE